MRLADIGRLVLLCTTWGLNFVVLKHVVTVMAVPPLFFSGVRFLLLFVLLLPWLAVPWGRVAPLALVGFLTGGAHFGLLSLGLMSASSASAAIMTLLGVPFLTVLSAIMLKERITARRSAAIAVVLTGAGIVIVDPAALAPSPGLLLIGIGIFGSALGVVVMKLIRNTHALEVQAWVGAVSAVPLLVLSALLEPKSFDTGIIGSADFWLAQAFSVLLVSIMGHSFHYALVRRYDVAVVAALTLLTPICGVSFSVLLGGEHLPASLVLGAGIALIGAAALMLEKARPAA